MPWKVFHNLIRTLMCGANKRLTKSSTCCYSLLLTPILINQVWLIPLIISGMSLFQTIVSKHLHTPL